jgi:hypothetical protein
MTPDEIRPHLRRYPFRPLRLIMSDGTQHELQEVADVFLSDRLLAIGVDHGQDGVAERALEYKPDDVVRIEFLEA